MTDYPNSESIGFPDKYTGPGFIELPNGNIRCYFFNEGAGIGSVDYTPEVIAQLTSNILNVAHNAYLETNPTHDPVEMPPLSAPVILANKFGLAPNPEPEFETLTVRIGAAVIGFAIHSTALELLGPVFQTASVPKRNPN